MNILILGETGVEKSTWINGIINYITYSALEEAEQYEPLSLIAGEKTTREPKLYSFKWNETKVQLIDTPGISDTDQDKKNFNAILEYLTNLDELHGICIILKPNNAKLTAIFNACIKKLLTHLDREVTQNIIFCLTKSESKYSQTDDTFSALKTLLLQDKDIGIELSKHTVYYMDSEPYRFLCGINNGTILNEDNREEISAVWNESVAETDRMFKHLATLKPYPIPDTIFMNVAKKINKTLNILILGQTDVGKSTWINSMVNYMTYSTFEEAEQNKPLSLIPASFCHIDENLDEYEIIIGEDANENHIAGQSTTQEPKSYFFNCGDNKIRLIDTPGIGDTRGIDQDKKNLDAILRYLSTLDELHGICILLKPNDAELTATLNFCIKELLTHLHRNAAQNIIIGFTNTRSTFYRPGDTLPALVKFLSQIKDVDIQLSQDKIYCMDNESFRFLCCTHYGVKFSEDDRKNFSASWDKSVAEINRMFEHIATLKPHAITDTILLNEVRKFIKILESIKKTEKSEEEIETEQVIISNDSLKLGSFLKTNSIIPYNDVIEDYLEILIRQEQEKVSAGGDSKTLDGLRESQREAAYKEEVLILNKLMQMVESIDVLGPNEIKQLLNDLNTRSLKGAELNKIQ